MKEAVTDGRIIVKGPLQFQRIEELHIATKYGDHTRMRMIGYLAEDIPWGAAISYLEGQEIRIVTLDEQGQEMSLPIFGGIIEKAYIEVENGSTKAFIYGVSATWLLDQEEKSRSFQNTSLTYQEVVRQVLQDVPGAAMIFCAEKKSIGQPVYQYRETDWEFLKRLAAHCGCYLFPGDISGEPKFYFGLPRGRDAGDYTTDIYISGFDQKYYDLYSYGRAQLPERKLFIYHQVERFEGGEVGDRVRFHSRELYICKKECCLDRGLLKYTFLLGPRELVTASKYFQRKLAGVSLPGKVLETRNEEVKIHLSIDEKQDKNTAYWYPWMPETGNLMYCMPEIGTQVVLYFGSEEESSAKCIRNVRTQTGGEVQDPARRLFTTRDQKRLALEPQSLSLQAQNIKGLQMQISDEQGISFDGNKEVSIMAQGNINIKGGRVNILAPAEISVVKLGASMLNMSNRFDAVGVKSMVGTSAVGVTFPNIQAVKKTKEVQAELTANEDAVQLVQPVYTGGNETKRGILATQIKQIVPDNFLLKGPAVVGTKAPIGKEMKRGALSTQIKQIVPDDFLSKGPAAATVEGKIKDIGDNDEL